MQEKEKMMQNKEILSYMRIHGSVTPIEALNAVGCFRLAARISDLRRAGHRIESVLEERNGKRYARYYLVESLQQAEMF